MKSGLVEDNILANVIECISEEEFNHCFAIENIMELQHAINLIDFDRLLTSDEHTSILNYYFDMCDIDRNARISPIRAALLFRRSLICNEVLGKIWDFVNPIDRGWIDRRQFILSMILIAKYQQSNELCKNLQELSCVQPPDLGPLPASLNQCSASINQLIRAENEFIKLAKEQPNGRWLVVPCSSVSNSPTGNRDEFCRTFLNLTDDSIITDPFQSLDNQYQSQFRSLAVKGVLSGEECRQIMCASGLSNENLASIWSDCDRNCIGSLDELGFVRAMRMIYLADRTSGLLLLNDNRSSNEKLAKQVDLIKRENSLMRSTQLSKYKVKIVEKKSELARLESEIELALRTAKELNATRCEKESNLERARTKLSNLAKRVDDLSSKLKELDGDIQCKNSQIQDIKKQLHNTQLRRNSIPDQMQTMKAKETILVKRVESQQDQIKDIAGQITDFENIIGEQKHGIKILSKIDDSMSTAKDTILSGSLPDAYKHLNECFQSKQSIDESFKSDPTKVKASTEYQREISHTPIPSSNTEKPIQNIRAKSSLDFTLAEFDPF
ncbi:hypothetical protein GJ496_004829 [Pomphorhynchus laevis]|nr:hypothetical protein GJ496_004829 [Pomphorhynchus laevis]